MKFLVQVPPSTSIGNGAVVTFRLPNYCTLIGAVAVWDSTDSEPADDLSTIVQEIRLRLNGVYNWRVRPDYFSLWNALTLPGSANPEDPGALNIPQSNNRQQHLFIPFAPTWDKGELAETAFALGTQGLSTVELEMLCLNPIPAGSNLQLVAVCQAGNAPVGDILKHREYPVPCGAGANWTFLDINKSDVGIYAIASLSAQATNLRVSVDKTVVWENASIGNQAMVLGAMGLTTQGNNNSNADGLVAFFPMTHRAQDFLSLRRPGGAQAIGELRVDGSQALAPPNNTLPLIVTSVGAADL